MKSSNKVANKNSIDPIDKIIFEKGLRIKNVVIDKKLDVLLFILNNGSVMKNNLSSYPRLKKANEIQLNKWSLIGNGVGVSWNDLNEDLSIKGFIQSYAVNNVLKLISENSKIIL